MPPLEHAYPQLGEVLEGKYQLERVVGEGAMGAVIQATHLLRQAPVALKFMSPSIINTPGVVERFLNEGVAASRIDNEHVVNVLDVSKLPSGLPYMVMEYLEGEDLEELLGREGQAGLASLARCVHFVLQVLRALQVAHRAGIIHRDLKPANCFVIEKDGEPDFIKILDFGISKVEPVAAQNSTLLAVAGSAASTSGGQRLNLTHAGAALGTPLYVSPEQARNARNVDARSDLYSVAALLYEMVSGRPPFDPESGGLGELFMLLATAEPAPLSDLRADLPVEFSEVVARGLAKAPDDRYQSSSEMAAALAPFADNRSELVLRQLLNRPAAMALGSSLTPRPLSVPASLSSLPAPAPSQGGKTQPGWLSSAPPGPVATAPGLGSADTGGGDAVSKRAVSRSAWLAGGGLALATAAATLLLNGPGSVVEGQAGAGLSGSGLGELPIAEGKAAEGNARAQEGRDNQAALAATPRVEAASTPDAGASGGNEPAPRAAERAKGEPHTEASPVARPSNKPSMAAPAKTQNSPSPGRLRLRDIGRGRGRQ